MAPSPPLARGVCAAPRGAAGRAELPRSAPRTQPACLSPGAPAAWGHHDPREDLGEVGSLGKPARAAMGWQQRGRSRQSRGAAPCPDPRCLARLCLGRPSRPEQEPGRGTGSAIGQASWGESMASRESEQPGSARGAAGKILPSASGQAFGTKPAGWQQELEPGKQGPNRALILTLALRCLL